MSPYLTRHILGTRMLFRLLRQEFPNFEEFNACWHMGWYAKKGSRGCVTMKSRRKFKVLVENLLAQIRTGGGSVFLLEGNGRSVTDILSGATRVQSYRADGTSDSLGDVSIQMQELVPDMPPWHIQPFQLCPGPSDDATGLWITEEGKSI
ncbi:hypothetical protein ACLB2K_050785 [Fragaria x ananassa]